MFGYCVRQTLRDTIVLPLEMAAAADTPLADLTVRLVYICR
jgi:hypothetical protein